MASHIETVQRLYAAFGQGDIPTILGELTADCAWEHDAVDHHGIPWLKPRVGPAEVAQFFGELATDLEFHRFEVLNLLAGGNQVVGVIDLEVTVRPSGRRVRDLEAHLWTFDADGKVAKFRHFIDTYLFHSAMA